MAHYLLKSPSDLEGAMIRLNRFIILFATALSVWSGSFTRPAHACTEELQPALRQTSDRLDELYLQAEVAQPTFDRVMADAALQAHAAYETSALKTRDRFESKTVGHARGRADAILDVLRGAIISDTLEGVQLALEAVRSNCEHAGIRVVRTSDYFAHPKPNGYRGIKINVEVPYFGPDGRRGLHIAELQIHWRKLYEIKKNQADALYRRIRDIEESTRPLAPAREQELERLRAEHKALYDNAMPSS